MTTLAQGASVNLTLANNGFLEVATNGGFGSVTITPTRGAAVTESWGPSPFRRRWNGPYPEGATVVLSNGTSAEFDYETDSSNLPASLQALVSAHGNAPRRLVLFGDSQTENNQDLGSFNFSALTQTGGLATLVGVQSQIGQIIKVGRVAESGYFGAHQITSMSGGNAQFPVPVDTPSPATSRPRGDGVGAYSGMLVQYTNRNASRGWMHLANYRAGGELFRIVQNAAYGGDTTWGMLERIDHPTWGVTPYQAEYVTVFGGINDITAGVPWTTVAANLRAIYDHLRARGYTIIAITICPVVSGHPAYGNADMDAGILRLNDWIRQYARNNTGFILWDFFSVINDPTSATLSGKADHIHPTDFIHFTPRAAWNLSTLILDSCRTMLPGVQNTLPSAAADSRAYNAAITQNQLNPMFTGSAGTASNLASGTVATNWNVNHNGNAGSTAVSSVVARTVAQDGDAIGNNQKVVISAAAAGDTGYIRNTPSNNSTLEVGAWYYVEAAVRVESWTNMNLPTLDYSMTIDGVTTGATTLASASADAWGAQPTGITANLVLRSPNFYVPAGTSASGFMSLNWRSNGVGGGTIYMGRAHCRKVSS